MSLALAGASQVGLAVTFAAIKSMEEYGHEVAPRCVHMSTYQPSTSFPSTPETLCSVPFNSTPLSLSLKQKQRTQRFIAIVTFFRLLPHVYDPEKFHVMGSLLRKGGLAFLQWEGPSFDGTKAAFSDSWWDLIDESEIWQRGVYYALCSSYSLISLVALVQLVRIHLRVPEYGWTTQKVFHLMNFVVNGLRAITFGFYRSVFHIRPKALGMVLLEMPALLFFSTYTLLVLFWAEIYQQARSLPTSKLRPTYYVVNGAVYFIQVCIWIFIRLTRNEAAFSISRLFFSVVSFCAALGFVIYGGRLFVMLRRFPIESRGRQNKLYEVGCVTGICCACFLIRCLVVSISAFDENADVDALEHPLLNLIYYTLVEVVPSALVLFILRKLPPKRVSDRYNPIR
ncbi:hypothetical protein SAY87_000350 [Trapa incisa]|nr:hypothetical protein SAY87_000350 [Trapa incisa]